MKTLILIIAALLIPIAAGAGTPSLVVDMPTKGTLPTEYRIALPEGQTWMQTTVPALTDGPYGFIADISNAPAGTTLITIQACIIDTFWGPVCSEAVTTL